METIIEKKTIWSKPRIVLSAILLSVAIASSTAGYITLNSPKSFTSTVKLQIVWFGSFGQATVDSREAAPYVELVNDPYFKKLVLSEAGKSNKSNRANPLPGNFKVSAKQIENTSMLEISVEASKPKDAKLLADAAAQALVKKSAEELKAPAFKNISFIIALVLEPIDKDLAELRGELFKLQDSVTKPPNVEDIIKEGNLDDQIAAKARSRLEKASSASPAELEQIDQELANLRSKLFKLKEAANATLSVDEKNKVANLEDQISAKESLRRTFTDYLTKAALDDLLNEKVRKKALKIVYSAEMPHRPSNPSWTKNMAVAMLSGLLISIAALSVADMFYRARY